MPAIQFKVTIHMVSSLGGIIAKKDNSVSWFETVDHYAKGVEISRQKMEEFLKTIDCYVIGARTYEYALALSRSYGWSYGDIPTIVVNDRNLPVDKPNIEIYSGNLKLNEVLKAKYKNV